MEHELLGTIVRWEGERWYVDNTDENFKDEDDATSLFLLPERYADAEANAELMRSGNPDSVGFWVCEDDVTPIRRYRVLVTKCISTEVLVWAEDEREAGDIADEQVCEGEVIFEPQIPDVMIGSISPL